MKRTMCCCNISYRWVLLFSFSAVFSLVTFNQVIANNSIHSLKLTYR